MVLFDVGAMLQFPIGLFYEDDYYIVMGVLFGFLLSRLNLGYLVNICDGS